MREILEYISTLTSKYFDLKIDYKLFDFECIEDKAIVLEIENPHKNIKSKIVLDVFPRNTKSHIT